MVDKKTGLVSEGKFNEVIEVRTKRKDGSLRIIQNFENCPSLAEQHSAQMTDINWLIKKFQPDELAAYIQTKNMLRREITGHDFSQEPELQEAMNVSYRLKKQFDSLPDEVKYQFKGPVDFLKFIDNPANEEKMLKLGILTKKQVADVKDAVEPTIPTGTQPKSQNQEKLASPSSKA